MYLISRMEELPDSIWCWKIPVAAKYRYETALTSHIGFLRLLLLLLGPLKGPTSLEHERDIMLFGIVWQTCPVYLEEVFVVFRILDKRIQHLREVLLQMAS